MSAFTETTRLPGYRSDVGLGLAHLIELLGQEVPEDDLEVEAAQVPVVPDAQNLGLGMRLAVAAVVGLDLQITKGKSDRILHHINFPYCR